MSERSIWTCAVSNGSIRVVTLAQELSSLGPLAVRDRTVAQAAEGQRHAYVAHAQLSAGQLKKLRGPVRAARRPALTEDEEGILHQHLHAHLKNGHNKVGVWFTVQ